MSGKHVPIKTLQLKQVMVHLKCDTESAESLLVHLADCISLWALFLWLFVLVNE